MERSIRENNDNLFSDIDKKANIIDVISHYIHLEKRGSNYLALCPFHDDHNLGNFSVNEEKQIFKCFSCGESGGSIAFVKKYENCSWIDAAKIVCKICNINEPRLEALNKKEVINKDIEKLYEIMNYITSYYNLSLFKTDEGKEALEYLHSRGLNDEIIQNFKIGYSLKDGESVINFLQKKGFSLKDINEIGLINLSDNKTSDRNAKRISFPISNANGQVVGFSCRIFGNNKSEAKYVNTTNTKIFNKSNLLYNYYECQKAVKKTGYVYLFEGFMDAIASWRIGFQNCIALMGTQITPSHLKMLKELNATIRLCLDLDEPGQDAMYKTIIIFEKEKIQYQLVNNNVSFSYKDSDEILFNLGEQALKDFLSNVIDKIDWMLNYLKKKYSLNSLENKVKIVEEFTPFFININDTLLKDAYLKKLSAITGFDLKILAEKINSYKNNFVSYDNYNEAKETDLIAETNKSLQVNKSKIDKKFLRKLEIDEKLLAQYMLNSFYAYKLIGEEEVSFYINQYKIVLDAINEYVEKNNITENNYNYEDLVNFIKTNVSDSDKTIEIIENLKFSKMDEPFNIENCKELVIDVKKCQKNFRNSNIINNFKDKKNDDDIEMIGHLINIIKS